MNVATQIKSKMGDRIKRITISKGINISVPAISYYTLCFDFSIKVNKKN